MGPASHRSRKGPPPPGLANHCAGALTTPRSSVLRVRIDLNCFGACGPTFDPGPIGNDGRPNNCRRRGYCWLRGLLWDHLAACLLACRHACMTNTLERGVPLSREATTNPAHRLDMRIAASLDCDAHGSMAAGRQFGDFGR